jgi:FtsZ-binding cell division protein ZapB
VGTYALQYHQTGHNNTALGYNAGRGNSGVNFSSCTFIGANSYLTTSRTNVTLLGTGIADGLCTGDNQVLLGNTSVAQIRAQVGSITTYSDKRFKFNIQEDVPGLNFINRLKPVTYQQNPEILHQIWGTPDSIVKQIDHSEIKQKRFIGFLAQDVEKAAQECNWNFPGIDVPRNEKEVYSLRYVDFIMPLVKSVQELNAQNEKLQSENAGLKVRMEKLEKENAEMKVRYEKLEQENAGMKAQIQKINEVLNIKAEK